MDQSNEIGIRLMGDFSVAVNGEPVTKEIAKSRKGTALLQLLILNRGEPVSSQRIYELLWAGETNTNPENALKTMVSRFRTSLNALSETLASCIVTGHGAYRFQKSDRISVDYEEIIGLCDTLRGDPDGAEQNLPLYEQLLTRCTGKLLANVRADWVQEKRTELYEMCSDTIMRYVQHLTRLERTDDVIYTCRRMLEVDAYDERFHVRLMQAMLERGDVNDAMLQHRHVSDLYYHGMGQQPPESIRSFYDRIVSAERTIDDSLVEICNDLRAYEKTVGAFVCSYDIFREIYSLQVRNVTRMGLKVYVMLITLRRSDDGTMEPMKLNSMMDSLQEILRVSLRRGDVVSRYTASRFALLLPMAAADGADVVMERVKRSFYRQFGRSDMILNYKLGEVEQ